MKKKFVLTLALVLIVAVGLSAATPLEVGGTFKTGYKFTFVQNGNGIAGTEVKSEAKNAAVSVAGDFWKVSLAGGTIGFDAKMAAKAEIYLDKALAEQGMDMGDLTLKMTIGNMADLGGLSAYANSRDDLSGLKMASGFSGAYATSLTVGYGDLVTVMVGADPASFIDQKIAAVDKYYYIDQTTGLITSDAAILAKTIASNNAFVISAKTTPVEGVSAAVAYTNVSETGAYKAPTDYPYLPNAAKFNKSSKGAIAGSVKVDVAALAGIEDFGLTASAYDLFNLETEKNLLFVEVNGSFGDFSAWTEYRILDTYNDMMLSVSYAGIENVGLSATLNLDDITNKDATYAKTEVKIGGGATYAMGGVTYALDADYAIQAKTFTMSPSVKIAF